MKFNIEKYMYTRNVYYTIYNVYTRSFLKYKTGSTIKIDTIKSRLTQQKVIIINK